MRPLDGYPQSVGFSKVSVFPHAGPTSYAKVVVDTPAEAVPASGGDLVEAVEAGLKLFDVVIAGLSDSSLYLVQAIPVARSDYQTGAAQTTYRLQWFYAASLGEVGGGSDLSGEVVRLFAMGPK